MRAHLGFSSDIQTKLQNFVEKETENFYDEIAAKNVKQFKEESSYKTKALEWSKAYSQVLFCGLLYIYVFPKMVLLVSTYFKWAYMCVIVMSSFQFKHIDTVMCRRF